MKNQHGLGITGYIFVLFLLSMGALLVFKLFPPYTEYFMIQREFKNLTVNPGLQDGKALKSAFQRYADINNVTGINAADIEISNTAVSAKYSVKVPLFANINLLLEFNPSSAVD
jgi:hypothetical protein